MDLGFADQIARSLPSAVWRVGARMGSHELHLRGFDITIAKLTLAGTSVRKARGRYTDCATENILIP